jgi:hypothetical protein
MMANVMTPLLFDMIGPLGEGLIRPIFGPVVVRLLFKFIGWLLVARLYGTELHSPIGKRNVGALDHSGLILANFTTLATCQLQTATPPRSRVP